MSGREYTSMENHKQTRSMRLKFRASGGHDEFKDPGRNMYAKLLQAPGNYDRNLIDRQLLMLSMSNDTVLNII